ncbi:MAG: hypothetical protein WD232_03440 [Acidimicrobiales bacterium]
MRVAFIGKGGAGKSVIVGTFCRLLARSDHSPVVAIDSDTMPGLAYSLGVPSTETMLDPDIVEEVGEEDDRTWVLREGLDPAGVVERYAVEGPDGVRLLQLGKLRGHARAIGPSFRAFRILVQRLPETGWHLVGDLPGGTRQPFSGWAGFADLVVVVAEATPSSMLAARRLARLAGTRHGPGEDRMVAIANKVDDAADGDRLQQFCGLRVIGTVPADPSVRAAERSGVALLDASPDSPAVEAVTSLLHTITAEAP